MKRILITGAAGIIGNALRQGLRGSYSLIRLADIASLGSTAAGEELATTDIRDIAALEKAMAGIDCVVHLAGVPEEAAWDQVLPLNIEGCYNVFEATRAPLHRSPELPLRDRLRCFQQLTQPLG